MANLFKKNLKFFRNTSNLFKCMILNLYTWKVNNLHIRITANVELFIPSCFFKFWYTCINFYFFYNGFYKNDLPCLHNI